MKRFVFLFLAIFTFNSLVSEAAAKYTDAQINTMGQKILQENQLPREVKFNIVESETVNAYADSDNNIVIYTGILNLVEQDEEIAGIMAHEIGHIMKSHCYKQTFFNLALNIVKSKITNKYAATGAELASGLASNKVSREHEYDADYTSADLLYKAGYNPLGLISVLNKISSNYIDILADHPSGDKRLMALYDYINYNYPDEVKKGYNTNAYNSFLAYAQPTIEKRNNDSKINKKYINTQKKLKEKREKAAKKMMNTTDPWAAGYSALMLMVGNEN